MSILLHRIPNLILNPKSLFDTLDYQKKVDSIIRSADDDSFFFIHIGAHDGKSADNISDNIPRWEGIMVEPQKKQFEQLKQNYSDHENIEFENSAITGKDGKISFYISGLSFLSSVHDKDWYKGRNSWISYLTRALFPTRKAKVNSMTFSTLLQKYSVKKIDLLNIDTEGYDFEILRQIDYDNIRPGMIQYELIHSHQKEESMSFLRKKGYKVFSDGWDAFAYTN